MSVDLRQLKEAGLLLFEEPTSLTDAQVQQVIEYQEELRQLVRYLPQQITTISLVPRYRSRKRELEKLSLSELEARVLGFARARSRAAEDDSDYDPMGGEITEPPIDSDERIIREILRERRTQSAHWNERVALVGKPIPGGPFNEGFPDDHYHFRKRGGDAPVRWRLLLDSGEFTEAFAVYPHGNITGPPHAWVGTLSSMKIEYETVAAWCLIGEHETD